MRYFDLFDWRHDPIAQLPSHGTIGVTHHDFSPWLLETGSTPLRRVLPIVDDEATPGVEAAKREDGSVASRY